MIKYNDRIPKIKNKKIKTPRVVLKLYPAKESLGTSKHRSLGPSNLGWGRPVNVHF